MSRADNLVPQPEAVVASTVVTTTSTTPVTLQEATTMIEVIAKNGDAYIQFGSNEAAATATTSNNGFKARVNDGQVRHYIVGLRTTLSIAGSSTSTEVTVIEYRVS